MATEPTRCEWCLGDALMRDYHDEEWGVPVRDDLSLFAKLILDGAQAGLSWRTILHKKEGYLHAFDGLDPVKIARYDEVDVARLRQDSGIVRNQPKIRATIGNARAYLELQNEGVAFSDYLWAFVDGKPIHNRWRELSQIPAETPLSGTISKDLKRRGFKFVGPTIVYAFMQAVGMVNDHLVRCFRYDEV